MLGTHTAMELPVLLVWVDFRHFGPFLVFLLVIPAYINMMFT